MRKPSSRLLLPVALLLAASLFVPVAMAAPEIRPTTDSLVAVTLSDRIYIECFGTGAAATAPSLSINGPSGETLVFRGLSATASCTPDLPTTTLCGVAFGGPASQSSYGTFTFDGFQIDGPMMWVTEVNEGDFVGNPADGTWAVTISVPVQSLNFCIVVDGKGFTDGTASGSGGTCFWNWHHTAVGANFIDSGPCETVSGGAEDDPNNFRYFSDQTPADDDPQPFTTDNTVSCPSTLTIRGLWIRGATQTDNTVVRFAHRQGLQNPLDNDMSNDLDVLLTTLVDDGAGANGDHSATVLYNNAVGNSYQFFARAGASGTEQIGAVVRVPPEQCTITGLAGALALIHNEIIVDITASQAQCNGDQTSFTIDADETAIITVSDLDVDIIRTNDGTALLTIDDAEMLSANQGQIFFFNRTLPAGSYMAWVRLDLGGIGAVDAFDSVAFNVPLGTCVDTPTVPTDLTPVFENFTNIRTNLSRMEGRLNTTCQKTTSVDCEGIKARVNQTHLSIVYQVNQLWARANTTCQKTFFATDGCEGVENLCASTCNITVDNGPVIQALGETEMRFIGLTTEESWTLLALIALMIWALYNEWYWAFGAMLLGVLGVVLGIGDYNAPLLVFLIILGFAMQLLINKRNKKRAEEEAAGQQASA